MIPDGVTGIGECAFSECTALASIRIPDSVTGIGEEAFYGCSSLTSITFEGSKPAMESGVFDFPGSPNIPTNVYRYDATLNIGDCSDGRILTYHGIYRISFMDGDDVLRRQYLLPGEEPSFGGTPEKEGHTFKRWSPAIPASMPATDVAVYAFWTINQYTITFDTAGGSVIPAITKDYGSPITAPANPIRSGYTFVRWDPAIPAVMPDENVTVTAVWAEAEPSLPGFGSDMLLYAGIAAAAVAALVIAAVFIRRR